MTCSFYRCLLIEIGACVCMHIMCECVRACMRTVDFHRSTGPKKRKKSETREGSSAEASSASQVRQQKPAQIPALTPGKGHVRLQSKFLSDKSVKTQAEWGCPSSMQRQGGKHSGGHHHHHHASALD